MRCSVRLALELTFQVAYKSHCPVERSVTKVAQRFRSINLIRLWPYNCSCFSHGPSYLSMTFYFCKWNLMHRLEGAVGSCCFTHCGATLPICINMYIFVYSWLRAREEAARSAGTLSSCTKGNMFLRNIHERMYARSSCWFVLILYPGYCYVPPASCPHRQAMQSDREPNIHEFRFEQNSTSKFRVYELTQGAVLVQRTAKRVFVYTSQSIWLVEMKK